MNNRVLLRAVLFSNTKSRVRYQANTGFTVESFFSYSSQNNTSNKGGAKN